MRRTPVAARLPFSTGIGRASRGRSSIGSICTSRGHACRWRCSVTRRPARRHRSPCGRASERRAPVNGAASLPVPCRSTRTSPDARFAVDAASALPVAGSSRPPATASDSPRGPTRASSAWRARSPTWRARTRSPRRTSPRRSSTAASIGTPPIPVDKRAGGRHVLVAPRSGEIGDAAGDHGPGVPSTRLSLDRQGGPSALDRAPLVLPDRDGRDPARPGRVPRAPRAGAPAPSRRLSRSPPPRVVPAHLAERSDLCRDRRRFSLVARCRRALGSARHTSGQGTTGAARGATRAPALAPGAAAQLHRRSLRDRVAALLEAEPPRSEPRPDPGGTPPLRRSGRALAPLAPASTRPSHGARTWSTAAAAAATIFAPSPRAAIMANVSAAARTARLRALLAERIVVLDGATGTYLQGRDLRAADFGGEQYEGCNEHLVLTRPDVVRDMHTGYLAAGADIIETDTFGGTRIVLAEYGLESRVREINATAHRLSSETSARFETPDHPRFVA